MDTLTTIYWVCFGVGLVYVVISGALGAVSSGLDAVGDGGDIDLDVDHDLGLDVDHDLDLDVEHNIDLDHSAEHGEIIAGHDVSGDAMPTFNIFSPLTIAGFLCAFGGGGLVASNFGAGLLYGLSIASLSGLVMGLLLWLVVGKLLYSMQGTSEAQQSSMIGLEAEVLVPVEHETSGEIAYVLSGVRYTAPARLIKDGRAEQRDVVRIRRMKGNIVYVEQKKDLLT